MVYQQTATQFVKYVQRFREAYKVWRGISEHVEESYSEDARFPSRSGFLSCSVVRYSLENEFSVQAGSELARTRC